MFYVVKEKHRKMLCVECCKRSDTIIERVTVNQEERFEDRCNLLIRNTVLCKENGTCSVRERESQLQLPRLFIDFRYTGSA